MDKEILAQANNKIVQQQELIKKKNEDIQALQQENLQLSQVMKKFDYEKEGLVERNKNIQNLLDKQKQKSEQLRKRVVEVDFNNKELLLDIKKIQEINEVFKKETKEKFQKELEIGELKERNAILLKNLEEFDREEINVKLQELQLQNQRLVK